jgi:hypothetical protein
MANATAGANSVAKAAPPSSRNPLDPFAAMRAQEEARSSANAVLAGRKVHYTKPTAAVAALKSITAAAAPVKSVPKQQQPPTQRKGEARAAAAATRRLPVHILSCSSPRWRAVLEARSAAHHAAAERRALGPRNCAKQPKQRVVKKGRRAGPAIESLAPSRAAIREAKLRVQRHVKEQRDSAAVPPPQQSSLLVKAATQRWAAAHSAADKKKAAQEKKDAQSKLASSLRRRRAAPRPSELVMRPAVVDHPRSQKDRGVPAVLNSTACSRAFNLFRLAWFEAHRARIVRSLAGIRALRLAQPSYEVQTRFLAAAARANIHSGDRNTLASFHGTARHNVDSILQHGFLRPGGLHPETGRRMPVVHGSSYGVGIYSSLTAPYSLHYCHAHDSMFVCAVLDVNRPGGLVKHGGGICVAHDQAIIVPMLEMDFDRSVANSGAAVSAANNNVALSANIPRARKVSTLQIKADMRRADERTMHAPALVMLRAILRGLQSRVLRDARRYAEASE